MINEISINSNNAIEMSRGDLLTWLNDLLNTNLSKIQQLGTGSTYCQLLQELYPAQKIPLNKVNFKAKNQYQYLNNFKVLQQSFTKFGITRHIDVEKLIKCKYQDNLEFLQWFKKIFDNSGHSQQSNVLGGKLKDKENRMTFSRQTSSSNGGTINNDKVQTNYQQDKSDKLSLDRQRQTLPSQRKVVSKNTTVKSSNLNQINTNKNINNSEQFQSQKLINNKKDTVQQIQSYYSPSKGIPPMLNILNSLPAENFYHIEQRQFMMKKFKQIEHLLEFWNYDKSSKQLADNVRKIVLCPSDMSDFQIDQITGQVNIKQIKQTNFDLKQFNQQEQCPEIEKEDEITKTVSNIIKANQASNAQNQTQKYPNQGENPDQVHLTQQKQQREEQEQENNQTIITNQNIKTQLFVESKSSSLNIQN